MPRQAAGRARALARSGRLRYASTPPVRESSIDPRKPASGEDSGSTEPRARGQPRIVPDAAAGTADQARPERWTWMAMSAELVPERLRGRFFASTSIASGIVAVQLVTSLLIPLLPLPWIWAMEPWHAWLMMGLGGFF